MIRIVSFILLALLSSVSVANEETSPTTIRGATTTDVFSTKQLFDADVIFIDVRNDQQWSNGHIPNALHIHIKEFTQQSLGNSIPTKDTPIVIYCADSRCQDSAKACRLAIKWGFTKVFYFRDGFILWQARGMPVE